ncbi:MAG: thioredoxin [Pseudomonadota bacterium]
MATISVTDADFETSVLEADLPVVVDFWAEWCGPCKQIGPALEKLSEEFDGKIQIAKLNIDENPMTPSKFGIRGIPTLLMFKGGELVSKKIGAAPQSALQAWIEDEI